jgi:hypothetical protein
MGCGLGGFWAARGLTRDFTGKFAEKIFWERAELEVDPPFARPPQRAKTARRGPRSRSEGWGTHFLWEDQDSKNLGRVAHPP